MIGNRLYLPFPVVNTGTNEGDELFAEYRHQASSSTMLRWQNADETYRRVSTATGRQYQEMSQPICHFLSVRFKTNKAPIQEEQLLNEAGISSEYIDQSYFLKWKYTFSREVIQPHRQSCMVSRHRQWYVSTTMAYIEIGTGNFHHAKISPTQQSS